MKKLYTLLFLLFGSMNLHAQIVNDQCENALQIGEVDNLAFSNIMADTDGPYHEDSPCPSSSEMGQDSIFNDIWYLYTPTFTGLAEWTMCGTADFDTKIAVYQPGATCPLSDEDLLDCNEDGTNCSNSTSVIVFSVTQGESYLLRLGAYGETSPGEEGSGTFSISEFISTIPNDFCENAEVVTLGVDQEFTTSGALTDGPDHPGNNTCFGFGSTTAGSDIWYLFTPDFTGSARWSTCSTVSFDTRLAVYGPNVSCPVEASDLYACNDDGPGCTGYSSDLFFDVEAGQTYLLRLGGYSGDSGTGTFDLVNAMPPEPPVNDLCTDAIPLIINDPNDVQDTEGTTVNALFDSDNYPFPNCLANTTGGEFADVFYSFNSDGYERLELNFANLTADAQYFIDVLVDCSSVLDTLITESACFLLDGTTGINIIKDTIEVLPSEAADYILRISTRVTSDLPGDFLVWLSAVGGVDTEDPNLVQQMTFGPNPIMSDVGILTTRLEKATLAELSISDISGQWVMAHRTYDLSAGVNQVPIDMSELTQGLYFLTLTVDQTSKTIKITKL